MSFAKKSVLRALAVAATVFAFAACPAAEEKPRGRDLPVANTGGVKGPASAPGLKPVANPMPNFGASAGSQPSAPSSQPAAPGKIVKGAASSQPMAAPGNIMSGKVAEVHHVKEYTYVKLATKEGEIWAAIPKTESVNTGQSITLNRDMWMNGFQSPSLNRTFDRIAFGTLVN